MKQKISNLNSYSAIQKNKIRIEFRNKIQLNFASYESKVIEKYGRKLGRINLDKAYINLFNFELYDSLRTIDYKKSIELVHNLEMNDKIDNKNDKIFTNDITTILLLFLPYLIRSHKYILINQNEYSINSINSNNSKYKFTTNKKDLQTKIKSFFINYNKSNFELHRLEMLNYLEIFLNLYSADEESMIKQEEINSNLLYHYFRPFILPELYTYDF